VIRNVTILLLVLSLIVLYFVAQSTIFAKPTGTYETIIIDKREQTTVIFTGIFVPIPQYILETTELNQLNVKKHVYDRINVGDRVTVTRFSNGQHKLQG
jgi:membrane protease YdiL (CAAX protease family)